MAGVALHLDNKMFLTQNTAPKLCCTVPPLAMAANKVIIDRTGVFSSFS